MEVAQARGRAAGFAGFCEGGQKQPDQNRNDRDDHEQLDEREGLASD
jgi:hypothetical protein